MTAAGSDADLIADSVDRPERFEAIFDRHHQLADERAADAQHSPGPLV
jgi:hypothetical protein